MTENARLILADCFALAVSADMPRMAGEVNSGIRIQDALDLKTEHSRRMRQIAY